MKQMHRKWLAAVLALFLLLCGCGSGEEAPYEEGAGEAQRTEMLEETEQAPEDAGEDGWAIYWYLCGSDLETNGGYASYDLAEMMAVELPENVQVIIQSGGAQAWKNDYMPSDAIGRYLYDSDGFFPIEELPDANMGDPQTLIDFLSFCEENYPAENTMAIFWNHGAGSVGGAAFDEKFDGDSLTLDEFYAAFSEVYPLSSEEPPLDIIGFDACLMATIDTAFTFWDISRYLVASEELEPGSGWNYTGLAQALADDPSMEADDLGRAICDSFMEACEFDESSADVTLSLVDLGAFGPLMTAYEEFGSQALLTALDSPYFFSELGREAGRSENYGGNTPDEGYTNMMDLGHWAENCLPLLPEEAQAVLDALDQCVVYQVKGPYRSQASGLSCYYPYIGNEDNFAGYCDIAAGEAFQHLYGYELYGEISEEGMAYINGIGFEEDELPQVPTLEDYFDGDYPLYVDENGYAVLDVGAEIASLLSDVYFQLCYVNLEQDINIALGRDNNLIADWEYGVFMDNFHATWGSIDGNVVYMDIIYESDEYNTYTVPILLNGEEYNLRVVYDHEEGEYHILGARKGLDDTGMADKNLVQLQPGDEVTLVLYAATATGDDGYQPYTSTVFTVTEDTAFGEIALDDGNYMMLFQMVDIRDNTVWSEPAIFAVDGGNIYTGV